MDKIIEFFTELFSKYNLSSELGELSDSWKAFVEAIQAIFS